MKSERYQWAAFGDVNAFFGLMLDNIAGLIMTVSMLASIFKFPVDFALRYMVPGTAIGVLIGDFLYFLLAFKLAGKERRSDVTAMPLGLDTPSTIGMVLFVLGPAFLAANHAELIEVAKQHSLWEANAVESSLTALRSAAKDQPEIAAAIQAAEHRAATTTWHIGICAIFLTGCIKCFFALCANQVRRLCPRAGLLGSLAAIALILIAFTQLPKLAANPIVGLSSLVVVLYALNARGRLPFQIPGALAAVLVGSFFWYVMMAIESTTGTVLVAPAYAGNQVWMPTEWLTVFQFQWIQEMQETLVYLPYIIPFSVAAVVGGLDCTESAASAGDDYNVAHIVGIESVATILASLCGGVIQTAPYIGHPAYKAMGGRAAYVLATALFIGGAGLIGYFGVLFRVIPEAAVLPILVFVGIEITAQSYETTPKKHYAALAVACLPVLAKLIMIYMGQLMPAVNFDRLDPQDAANLQSMLLYLMVLAGGFIMTSVIWASAMSHLIDRRFFAAATYWAIGSVFVLFGVMHSPLPGEKMFLPWQIAAMEPPVKKIVIEFAIAYGVMSATTFGLGWMLRDNAQDKEGT